MTRKISKSLSEIIANMKKQHKTTREIHTWLRNNGIDVTMTSVRYHALEMTRFRIKTPSKCTWRVKQIVEALSHEHEGRTAAEIRQILQSRYALDISCSSIRRMRRQLGRTVCRTRIHRVIMDVNKARRVEQARQWIESGEKFTDVIFTDETSVTLERFLRTSFRKCATKPRRKHTLKVLVWAGISRRGLGPLFIFEGILDKEFFQEKIIKDYLLPYVRARWPSGHRLFQDNHPSHLASATFLKENGINWQLTPPESPDMNPIKLVWVQLKKFIRAEIKPKNKQELVDGILKFWDDILTRDECNSYIDRLYKVLPMVIERKGEATAI